MNINIIMAIITGVVAVSFIDSTGSIMSRRLNFNYGWFTIFSIAIYSIIPYYLSGITTFEMALLSNCFVGIYDATIGYKISILLKANTGKDPEDGFEMTLPLRLMVTICFAFIFAYVGYTLGKA